MSYILSVSVGSKQTRLCFTVRGGGEGGEAGEAAREDERRHLEQEPRKASSWWWRGLPHEENPLPLFDAQTHARVGFASVWLRSACW